MDKQKDLGLEENHIGPSRLLNYKCEVTSTSTKDPHCLLSLELEDKTKCNSSNKEAVTMALKSSTLDALLSSFDKIKHQLSSFNANS